MLNVIPKPLAVKINGGKVCFSRRTKLTGEFSSMFPVLSEMLPDYAAGENSLNFVCDSSLPAEGYKIRCKDGDIEISAADERGAFYGAMTLLQAATGGETEAFEAEDAPAYAFRGFMLDCSRHFWTVKKIKQLIDLMARLKMNEFHWHLTDDQGWRVEIKKYPLLTQKGAVRRITDGIDKSGQQHPGHIGETYGEGMFYSQDEVRDIVSYAKERMIEIIPEFDMPGHLTSAIACYPDLYCSREPIDVSDTWGVHDNIGCVGREELFRFAEDVIDELCGLFPGRYFHIGGDEVPKQHWKECPDCQRRIREEGLADEEALQGYFNDRISAYLASKDKVMIGWNEILHTGHPDKAHIVAQWWYISDTDVEKEWVNGGGRAVISPSPYFYMDHPYVVKPLSKTYGFTPELLGADDRSKVLGIEIPQWTERIATEEKLDLNTYARLIAASEVAWTPYEQRRYEEFEQRLEAERGYFAELGFEIADQHIYRGECWPADAPEDPEERIKFGFYYWRRTDPDFEVKAARKLKNPAES